jgi:N-hydroxyarylamine O-acetyltransferase
MTTANLTSPGDDVISRFDNVIAASTRDAYLRRLQVPVEAPSVEALARLHRAQVERVPYETTWLHMGEPWTVDAMASVQRIAHGGRGGYCYHVNGAFSLVLDALGYHVTRHVGGVHDAGEPIAPALGNHLVLLAHDLPTDANPDGHWLVDAGLGDGLHEPLPLVAGEYRQGPFTYRLTAEADGGWHLDHDELGSFGGVAITPEHVGMTRFEERHHFLSTSPDSSFARTATVQRRHAGGVDLLRGLVLTNIGTDGVTKTVVDGRDDWFALLGVLGLHLRVPNAARERLWSKVTSAHATWAESAA